MKALLSLLLMVCWCTVIAATIPPDYKDAQELEALNCVGEAAQTCINNICLTSENRDCPDQCNYLAQKKCLYKQEE